MVRLWEKQDLFHFFQSLLDHLIFFHYPHGSQTNKLINLLIAQTFQPHLGRIYQRLVNGCWELCRKHRPKWQMQKKKGLNMFAGELLYLQLILNDLNWDKQMAN